MSKTGIIWLLIAMVSLPGVPARAWNDRGHMLIALLAYRKLDAQEKAQVGAILEQHPHYQLFLRRDRPSHAPAAEWAFMKAAAWPDSVRSAKHRADFHRARWHYINIPFTPEGEVSQLTGKKFETPTINVLFAIDECRDLLSEDYPSVQRKAIHLAWLQHLIGDIHQPLHCVTLVHRAFPEGDRGGNQVAVRTREGVKRLHAYWDEALGVDATYDSIVAEADELAADPELAESRFPELTQHTTPKSWSEEGHAASRQYVYLNGALPIADYDAFDRKQLTADQVPLLPTEYEQAARQLVRRRAVLASHRLAAAIRQSL